MCYGPWQHARFSGKTITENGRLETVNRNPQYACADRVFILQARVEVFSRLF